MALTWRDTYKQPQADVSGLIQGGALAAKSIAGLGTAVQGFDDNNQLAELARFTDAKVLDAAMRSGQFNGASPEVLKQAMNRSSDLLANATNQQTMDQATVMNPELYRQRVLNNDGTAENNAQTAWGNTNTRSNYVRDEGRAAMTREAQEAAMRLRVNGNLATVTGARDLARATAGMPLEAQTVFNQAAVAAQPTTFEPLAQMPGVGSSVGSSVSGAIAGAAGTTVPVVTAGTPTGHGTRNGSSYDVVLGYGEHGLPPKPASTMTIGEVQDFGTKVLIPATKGNKKYGLPETKGSSAIGKYQFTQETLGEYAPKVLGKDWKNQTYSPENQDKLAEALFNDRKNGNLKDTWQGLPNTTPGAYKNTPWSEMKEIISAVESKTNGASGTTTQQLGVTGSTLQSLNNFAKADAGVARVKAWEKAAGAAEGGTSIAEISNELSGGVFKKMNPNMVQAKLAEITRKIGTTGNARIAAEILKEAVSGENDFNILGPGPMGWQDVFDQDVINKNVQDYLDSKTISDTLATDQNLTNASDSLKVAQKRLEDTEAYRKIVAEQVRTKAIGVDPDALTTVDQTIVDAKSKVSELQKIVNDFRPVSKPRADARQKELDDNVRNDPSQSPEVNVLIAKAAENVKKQEIIRAGYKDMKAVVAGAQRGESPAVKLLQKYIERDAKLTKQLVGGSRFAGGKITDLTVPQ